jgi:obg-like ATPase 1
LTVIAEELRLKDEEVMNQTIDKFEKNVIRTNDKKSKPDHVKKSFCVQTLSKSGIILQDSLLKIKHLLVEEKKHIRFGEWNANDVNKLKYLLE